MNKIKIIEEQFIKKDLPKFGVGDTVKVLTRIPEGPDKVRLHPFEGVVISKEGLSASIRPLQAGQADLKVSVLPYPPIWHEK